MTNHNTRKRLNEPIRTRRVILEVAAKRGKIVHSKSRSGLVLILIGLESSDDVIRTHGGGVNTIWDVQWRVGDYKVIYLRFTVS